MLRPFFGFYGGKWRDAVKHYPAPAHSTIVEPFAGGAGFSIRYAHAKVVLCDIDPIIAGVWKYLTKVSAAEILQIPDIPPGGSVDDLAIGEEARHLVGLWLNRGASRPRKTPSKWMREGMSPSSFWGARVRARLARQVPLIRHWKIYNCAYQECPVMGPATWFIDPPYQNAGKHYAHGAAGINFDALGKWCRSRQGQVIVCENEGATWLPFERLGDVKTTRANKRSVEAVWLST